MRILQVCDFYPPDGGGMERHVQSLGHALVARGHELSVFTYAQRGAAAMYDQAIPVYRTRGTASALARLAADPTQVYPPPAPDPGFVRKLTAHIARHEPELMHAHGWSAYSCMAAARLLRRAPPVVVTAHDYGHVCVKRSMHRDDGPCSHAAPARCTACASSQYGPVRSALSTAALNLSNRLIDQTKRWIAVSQSVADVYVSGLGIDPVVVPSFVSDEVSADLRCAAGRPDQVPAGGDYLLFVGALGAHKGLEVLFDAYRRLDRPIPLVCIGERRTDTPTEVPAGVTITGKLDHASVMAATRHATVALTPSVWREPFGQTAVEAMLAGVPLIASDSGGYADTVVHEQTGLLVTPGDAAALAAAMARVLDDDALRARLRAHGPSHAEQFLVSAVAPRVEAVLADALAG